MRSLPLPLSQIVGPHSYYFERDDVMGMVAVESKTVGHDGGYPIEEATLYVYCDKCGSFNIRTHISLEKWIMIVIGLTVVAFGGRALWINSHESLIPCLAVLAIIALFVPWRDVLLGYKCRKCRNEKITDYNTLHYLPYDKGVVDVPNQLTQKRYIDKDFLSFSRYT
jgi:hypothetical protein